jgi:hypothetical protein
MKFKRRALPKKKAKSIRVRGLSPEVKYIDTNSNCAVNSTGALVLLNGCTEGTDVDERIGHHISVRKVMGAFGHAPDATTGVAQGHRILLVLDRQSNGSAPAITDILQSANTRSFANLDFADRFKILVDKVVIVSAYGDTGEYVQSSFECSIGCTTLYNTNNAGTIADINTNALYVVFVGSQASGTTDGQVYYNIRLLFTDQ